jgi:type IV secretory pathway VirB2 component (pilin)
VYFAVAVLADAVVVEGHVVVVGHVDWVVCLSRVVLLCGLFRAAIGTALVLGAASFSGAG